MTDSTDERKVMAAGAAAGARERAELVGLLETWGGDEQRWPAPAQARLAALMPFVADGDQLIAEARALDRMLDTLEQAGEAAASASATTSSLADRILAAAMAAPGPAHGSQSSGQVIALPRLRVEQQPPVRSPVRQKVSGWPARWQQAAGLMAASLLAGILLGGSFNFEPVVRDLSGATGSSTAEFEAITLALGEDEGGEELR